MLEKYLKMGSMYHQMIEIAQLTLFLVYGI